MSQALEQSIFRVLDAAGITVGTGFVVGETLAVTCAHVIKMAGLDPGSVVRVRFQCDGSSAPAQVMSEGWSPPEQKDIAFLRLFDRSKRALPLRLGYADRSFRHEFLAIGYPLPEVTEYRTANDRIGQLEEGKNGRCQLLHLRGEEITNGMSGGPVLDLDLDRVIGMITLGVDEKFTRLVYATPVEELKHLLPELPVDETAGPAQPDKDPLPPRGTLPEPGLLPPGLRMPFSRNAIFTGREADLLKLADGLVYAGQPGRVGITQPLAASGLGGIGKTQLAVEFCYRYGRWFEGVHWLSAANPSDIGAEIAACGQEMGLPNWPEQQEAQVALTLRAWESTPNRLVVLDNLEEPEALRSLLPRLNGLRVLITARNPNWPRELGVQVQRLDVLPRADSRALLRRLAPRLEPAPDAALDELCERLGDLPLALHLAGCYLDECASCSIAAYLEDMDRVGSPLAHISQKDWVNGSPTNHIPSLEATFALSWQRLAGAGEVERLARLLFQAAGYCAPNAPIPEDLLWETVKEVGLERALFERARYRLVGLGLFTAAEQGPMMHPLLTEFARQMQDKALAALKKYCHTLAQMAKNANDTELPAQFLPLLAHVEAASTIAESAGVEDAVGLWNHLGYHKNMVADFQRAKECYEQALRIDEQVYGPKHPNVARDINNLGHVLQDLGDLPGAKDCCERALRIDEQVYGPEHPNVAILVNNLGRVLQDLDDLPGATACFERALRIGEQVYGPEHPTVAIRVSNLGGVLQALGDLPGAKACFERALAIFRKFLPADHPNIQTVQENLEVVEKELRKKNS